MELIYAFIFRKRSLIRHLASTVYIGLGYVNASHVEESAVMVLLCCNNFGRIFSGHCFCPKLKSSEIFL